MSWLRAMGSGGGSPQPVPQPVVFNYTGQVQEYVAPASGTYKLEVWGAQGGNDSPSGASGALGGYSYGYKFLNIGDKLFICVGGKGSDATSTASATFPGGYNGGGSGHSSSSPSFRGAAGGGATHIATLPGTLQNIGETDFITNGYGLIVAGGGAGAMNDTTSTSKVPGSGGGLSGSDGLATSYYGHGGTQTAGGAGYDTAARGSFGQGGYSSANEQSGGGGGLYGGGAGRPGGGGSGYIGGVPAISCNDDVYAFGTTNNVNSGDGKAAITFITSSAPNVEAELVYQYQSISSSDYNSSSTVNIARTVEYTFQESGKFLAFAIHLGYSAVSTIAIAHYLSDGSLGTYDVVRETRSTDYNNGPYDLKIVSFDANIGDRYEFYQPTGGNFANNFVQIYKVNRTSISSLYYFAESGKAYGAHNISFSANNAIAIVFSFVSDGNTSNFDPKQHFISSVSGGGIDNQILVSTNKVGVGFGAVSVDIVMFDNIGTTYTFNKYFNQTESGKDYGVFGVAAVRLA